MTAIGRLLTHHLHDDVSSVTIGYLRPYENALATLSDRKVVIRFDDVDSDDWPVGALGVMITPTSVIIVQTCSDSAEEVHIDLALEIESSNGAIDARWGSISNGLGSFLCLLRNQADELLAAET